LGTKLRIFFSEVNLPQPTNSFLYLKNTKGLEVSVLLGVEVSVLLGAIDCLDVGV
jgi:hypothetical protein